MHAGRQASRDLTSEGARRDVGDETAKLAEDAEEDAPAILGGAGREGDEDDEGDVAARTGLGKDARDGTGRDGMDGETGWAWATARAEERGSARAASAHQPAQA